MTVRLRDCFFGHWDIPPDSEERLREADGVVTHEFGDQEHVSATTRDIVLRAVEVATALGKPMMCQYPGNRVAVAHGVTPVYTIRENLLNPGKYLDTEGVNYQVAMECLRLGWKTVVVVTTSDHLWRAGKNLERYGIEVRYPKTRDIAYDWRLLFTWRPWRGLLAVRSLFRARERYARYLYRKNGYFTPIASK